MKYLSLLLVMLFISSCCATKQVAKKTEKNIAELEDAVPVIEQIDTPDPIVEETEISDPLVTPELPETDTSIDENNAEKFYHKPWNDLLQRHVSDAGIVDYKGFQNDRYVLQHYITSLGKNMPTDTWSKEDKLAYWMNAYNAMTVDLIVRNYPIKSIKDIKDPWEQRLWKLGDKWYNLDEIEHQILRSMNEPRIHFGIVCASFSCPKLQNEAFTAVQLEDQLTKATKEFLADPNRNTLTADTIKISKIFKWFSKDFKQKGDLIDFINQYTDVEISSKAKTSFKDYNWDLNE